MFAGKVVLVAGGAGRVGSGIVMSFIKQGATVIVPSRSNDTLNTLRGYIKGNEAQLYTLKGNISDEKEVESIKNHIVDKFGSIDHLVTTLGGLRFDGPITQVPLAKLREVMNDWMESHLIVARTFLPIIADKEGSSYTIMTGPLGEWLINVEGSCLSVGACALYGLSMAIRAEYANRAVRVNEYRLCLIVRRDEELEHSNEHSHVLLGDHFVGVVASNVRDKVIRVDKSEQLKKPFEL